MKILTICPSIYPDKLSKMLDSFEVTRSKHTQLLVTSEKDTVPNVINKMFNKYPDFDFYHIANDDIIYHTPLWDIALAKKGKITYGDDTIQGQNLCTFPMIDGDIVRALGWLVMPEFKRYGGDVVWKFIGDQLKILEYIPTVKIEHLWEGADEQANTLDMYNFSQWLPTSHRDIDKIRKVLNGKLS